MAAGEILHTEHVERDGVSYKIAVYHSLAGYWANWTCLPCNIGGVLPAAKSIADVLEMAKAGLYDGHHVDAHRLGRSTRCHT